MKLTIKIDREQREQILRAWATAKFPGFAVETIDIPSPYSGNSHVELELTETPVDDDAMIANIQAALAEMSGTKAESPRTLAMIAAAKVKQHDIGRITAAELRRDEVDRQDIPSTPVPA